MFLWVDGDEDVEDRWWRGKRWKRIMFLQKTRGTIGGRAVPYAFVGCFDAVESYEDENHKGRESHVEYIQS